MSENLNVFIEKARAKDWSDEEIKNKLVAAGWHAEEVDNALKGEGLEVPKPPAGGPHPFHNSPHETISVVENFTPRGFEYKIFSLALIFALSSLVWLADVLIEGTDSTDEFAFPLTVLIVAGPVALLMFLRLKRAETAETQIRKDPSRRKAIQSILLVSFLAVLIHTIIIVYLILSGHYGSNTSDYVYNSDSPSLPNDLGQWLVTLVIAGGTFAYYWRDEHNPL